MSKAIFGIEALDKMISDALRFPSLVVVAGHPGAGKTTLASSICYANALKNLKCLYLSFQEDKEKLFKNMKNLGIDLEYTEKRGTLIFIKFPVVLSIDSLMNELSKLITSFNPRIVIVDSINVLLASVDKDEVKRAWLQNYFYELSKQVSGVVVLVSELPFGEERLQLGAIEFIADAILILKHRIEDGKLVRIMEIRKIRGAPVILAEIPFVITPRSGLKAHLPLILEEIPEEGEPITNPCKILDTAIGRLQKGHTMHILYPVGARPPEAFIVPISYALINRAKILLISFRASPKTLRTTIIKSFETTGFKEEYIEKFLDEYAIFKSFNPFALSSSELISQLIEVIDNTNPDVVVLHAFDIFAIAYRPRHFPVIYNVINYLKSKNILTIILSIKANENIILSLIRLSDAIIVFKFKYRNGKLVKTVHMWKRERNPYIVSEAELKNCIEDLINITLKQTQQY
ncbi:MAG: ATPase domain-containing protein [Ignisphaera sp.]